MGEMSPEERASRQGHPLPREEGVRKKTKRFVCTMILVVYADARDREEVRETLDSWVDLKRGPFEGRKAYLNVSGRGRLKIEELKA